MPPLRPCSRPAPSPRPRRRPSIAGCPLLPRTFPTNQRVDRLPTLPGSDAITASIGLDTGLHADFGSGRYEGRPIGIPYDVVTKRTPKSRVRFGYADESDRVRYPIPRGVHIEGGRDADGDRHALLVDRSACRLYELFDLQGRPGAWSAGSGATWSLRSTQGPPGGLDLRRRGRPADPAAARPPRRGRSAAGSTTRCA